MFTGLIGIKTELRVSPYRSALENKYISPKEWRRMKRGK
jgi:hypothetical protein